MSWIDKLYQTYEAHLGEVLVPDANGVILMPIAHTQQSAQIECTISNEGEFISARVVDKAGSATLIPCTSNSASRSGVNPAPHPMFDKLKYMAKDLGIYDDGKSSYDAFIKQLKDWCSSEYAHPKVVTLYEYLEKGTLTKDLIEKGILYCDERGKLLNKWSGDSEKPELFKVLTGTQVDAFLRFRVGGIEDLNNNIWMDKEISDLFIQYYINSQKGLHDDLCYITGEIGPCTDKTSSKIRNTADMAKLISSNDNSGFTYRGRISTPQEGLSISFEASQKAINALKWLIEKQGKRYAGGELVYITWGIDDTEFTDVTQDSESLFTSESDTPLTATTYEEFAKQFNHMISGYKTKHKVRIDDSVVIMGLDSATKGRLSIIYYLEAKESDLLERIEHWHTSCAWRFVKFVEDSETKKKSRHVWIGAPSMNDIIYAAYGDHVKDSLVKMSIKRLIKCISEGYAIPLDIVNSIYHKVLTRDGRSVYETDKLLNVACAVIRKSLNDRNGKKEEWIMGLDVTKKDNDYLSGRLLAYAHEIESYAIRKSENAQSLNGRETNAQRYLKQYQMFPKSTWYVIFDKLQPYIRKLRNGADFYVREMNAIMSEVDFESFEDKPLDKKFILAYGAQLAEFETRRIERVKSKKELAQNEGKQQVEERGNEDD